MMEMTIDEHIPGLISALSCTNNLGLILHNFQVDSRYLSLFTVFNMTFPSDEALTHIFAQILQGHCQPFNKDVQGTVPKLVQMTMDLYK